MTPNSQRRRLGAGARVFLGVGALGSALALAGSAKTAELAGVDVALKIWAAPEGSYRDHAGPFNAAADAVDLGREVGRGEVDLRVRHDGLTAEISTRSTATRGETLHTIGIVNELYYDAEVLAQHLTIGKKVMSWDVGFGFRPLDVVQQEDAAQRARRAARSRSLLASAPQLDHSGGGNCACEPRRA